MKILTRIAFGLVMIAAVGGAYWLGTQHTSKPAERSANANQVATHTIIIPTDITLSPNPPQVTIDKPTDVLLGEVKVPNTLLRAPAPSVEPEFIVPNLGR